MNYDSPFRKFMVVLTLLVTAFVILNGAYHAIKVFLWPLLKLIFELIF